MVNESSTSMTEDCHKPNYDWQKNVDLRPHCAVCKVEKNVEAKLKSGKCMSTSSRKKNSGELNSVNILIGVKHWPDKLTN